MVARKDGQRVEFYSRNDIDWTARFGTLVEAIRALPLDQVILDGEVCALKPDGRSDFQEIAKRHEGRSRAAISFITYST